MSNDYLIITVNRTLIYSLLSSPSTQEVMYLSTTTTATVCQVQVRKVTEEMQYSVYWTVVKMKMTDDRVYVLSIKLLKISVKRKVKSK